MAEGTGDEAEIGALERFALAMARAARAVTLPAMAEGGPAEDKGAGGAYDPVTEADRAAERAMRAMIEARFPDHGIAGEEYGERPGAGRRRWVLDPIDGTRAFVCGLPSWTTLVALEEDGAPLIGLIDAPALGELYLGGPRGARLVRAGSERALAASSCVALAEARLSTTDPFLFEGAEAEAFARVRGAARLARYGLDGYAYARLAAGSLDLIVESGLKPCDVAALVPVVRAAGGVIGDWEGGDDLAPGRIVAAATPALHAEAVAMLAGVIRHGGP